MPLYSTYAKHMESKLLYSEPDLLPFVKSREFQWSVLSNTQTSQSTKSSRNLTIAKVKSPAAHQGRPGSLMLISAMPPSASLRSITVSRGSRATSPFLYHHIPMGIISKVVEANQQLSSERGTTLILIGISGARCGES